MLHYSLVITERLKNGRTVTPSFKEREFSCNGRTKGGAAVEEEEGSFFISGLTVIGHGGRKEGRKAEKRRREKWGCEGKEKSVVSENRFNLQSAPILLGSYIAKGVKKAEAIKCRYAQVELTGVPSSPHMCNSLHGRANASRLGSFNLTRLWPWLRNI